MASQQTEPIAIVGSGCRFPGSANSPAALWKLLENPRDVVGVIPKDRFDVRGWFHKDGDHHGTSNVRHSYCLEEDLTKFDANFFGISGAEAESIDPQQRLLLETVYEALEAGGHTLQNLRGSDTAVYVGVMGGDHENNLLKDANSLPTYFATSTSRAILSNRISYFFDWHGPSITMDTACSSSMIAVHNAVRALRTGDSRMALACGTTLLLQPDMYVAETNLHMLSPSGRSRMWDAAADGYARGDGVAAVVMKKLSDAIADGDHVECIIRETGTNQDGRTKGITVPSSEAQAALIRKTYARAGLDLMKSTDRPQFFEAHGTGTKVGDPREAQAISSCFGGPNYDDPLYVGSVKTVIGHTEGCAGIAGLLKASLSLQAGVIPPNLLFERLNPDIEPFIQGLKVPTRALQWPLLPSGVPRRASVNSFGFGGANSHAILESYHTLADADHNTYDPPNIPFLFSAASEASLVATLRAHVTHLRNNQVNLRDLAWTLQQRRSTFSHKISFSARNAGSLTQKIELKLKEYDESSDSAIGFRSNSGPLKILGVFTGQGAQWPTMGAELIRSSQFVRQRLDELDEALVTLPPSDRPSWKLADQILLGAESSRLAEAALSQPLCTAVQVVLVDLLQKAGIKFQAVVGHSSGEIGAAYAADFISARDAIRIAYYRGLYCKLAGGGEGQKGAMLAVGTSLADALEVIELPAFEGCVSVAAHNSPASVTLSGDMEAIEGVKQIFEEEKKFARLLKVDTAYHSHHMLPCSDSYTNALRACNIQVNWNRDSSCTWYSSVMPGQVMEPNSSLHDSYWRDNMVNRVSFTEAVTAAVSTDEFTAAIEVGPHAALKGPALQSIAEVGVALPYTGVMHRGQNDMDALTDGLGYIWTRLGSGAVDFSAFDRLFDNLAKPKLVRNLPSYQWDRKTHWQESRISRKMRTRVAPFHELLGVPHVDNTDHDRRWSNMIKVSEMPWLNGHKLQGEPVFPAAGYVSMAFEAAKSIIGSRPVRLIELRNLVIGKALTFGNNLDPGAETLVTLTDISSALKDQKAQTANFAVYSSAKKSARDLEVNASGSIRIIFGESSVATLSPIQLDSSNMNEVEDDRFYTSLAGIGYDYSESFRTMSSLKRKLNQASALLSSFDYGSTDYGDDMEKLMVHPAMLDVAFQTAILAYSAPDDGRLWSLHVPTSFECIRINPELCSSVPLHSIQLPVRAQLLAPQSSSIDSINGNLDILTADEQYAMIQVHGAEVVPVAVPTASDDRTVFSSTQLGIASPHGPYVVGDLEPSEDEIEVVTVRERLSLYYYRKWLNELTAANWAKADWHFQRLHDSINHTLSLVDSEKHPYIKKEWVMDSTADIEALLQPYSGYVDIRLARAVGENLPAAVRRETTVIEHTRGLLDEYYKDGIGFKTYNEFLGRMVSQFVHVHPRARIFEVGAGTGGATKSVLQNIGRTFSAFMFTDISSGFFETAAEVFDDYKEKFTFKVFDTEKTPESQGFQEHTYDLVLASNVLHATASLEKTLKNVRRLLKPGGYLMLLEITNNKVAGLTASFGGFSGWWAGCEDGRQYAPTIDPVAWNTVLRQSGFSGVDAVTPSRNELAWPFSIIAAQAVDNRISHLRRPLSRSPDAVPIPHLAVIGGRSLEVAKIAEDIADLAEQCCDAVELHRDLESARHSFVSAQTVICLVDLDDPFFADLTSERMDCLKVMLEHSRNLLWVARGAQDHPYQHSMVGFLRALLHELPELALQHLDVAPVDQGTSRAIMEAAVRLNALSHWDVSGDLSSEILYPRETELVMQQGTVSVPRLLPDATKNSRINSQRRPVTRTTNLKNDVISIDSTKDGSPYLKDEPFSNGQYLGKNVMKPLFSTSFALAVAPGAHFFVSICVDDSAATTMIALSSSNSSECYPVASIPTHTGTDPASFLSAVSAEILSSSMLSTVKSGSKVLIHEPGMGSAGVSLASALRRQAATKKLELFFSTSKAESDSSWVRLSPWMQEYVVKKSLPPGITHFIDMATDDESVEVSTLVQKSLVGLHDCSHAEKFWRSHGSNVSVDSKMLTQLLTNATAYAEKHASEHSPSSIPLSQVPDIKTGSHPLTIVNWIADDTISVQVKRLVAKNLFSADKSYLLVGLTGQVGQSLCEWMVQNGARNIFLTSRQPIVDKKWLDSFKAVGATVAVYVMDVTNKTSIVEVVQDIQSRYPPIMGVANAAMVLRDVSFSNMTYEEMTTVLKPKVDGSNHLDEIFYDTKLDFFVLFSSASSVIGSFGQSNYAAACSYMTALVRQRRYRGLAASSFDIGRIAGIGYIERAGRAVQGILDKHYEPLSETDLHQMFAETIFIGLPEMNLDPVISTGIERVPSDRENPPPFIFYPRFSHYVTETPSMEGSDSSKQNIRPAQEQLAEATSTEQVVDIIKTCFAAKMQTILQLDEAVDMEVPIVEIGIDSLVAVEVRAWFLKELKTDMPVLKILGGATISDLADQASKKLPAGMVPEFGEKVVNESVAAKADVAKPPIRPGVVHTVSSTPTLANTATPSLAPSIATPSRSVSSKSSLSELESIAEQQEPKSLVNIAKTEPMSLSQSRFWLLDTFLEDRTASNVAFQYQILGNMNIDKLSRALELVVMRHESLRTFFVNDSTNPDLALQSVSQSSHVKLEHKTIKSVEEAKHEFEALKRYEYDMSKPELFRLIALTQGDSANYLLLSYHHIIMDGLSMQIFLSDLEKAYSGRPLGPPPQQFPAFSVEQRRAIKAGELDSELSYWKDIFNDSPTVLPLLPMASASSRMPISAFKSNTILKRLDHSIGKKVKEVAKSTRSTNFHVYLTVFRILLARFAEVSDLTIGIADANRTEDEISKTIGLFLNLLPLRFKPDATQTFAASVTETRNKAYSALANSRLPFNIMLQELHHVERSSTHAPFFQAFFDYKVGARRVQKFSDLQLHMQDNEGGETNYDINITVAEDDLGPAVVIDTQATIYDYQGTNLLLDSYINLLKEFLDTPSLKANEPSLYSPAQLQLAQSYGKGIDMESKWPETISRRVEQVAEENTDAIAVRDGMGVSITYGTLMSRSRAIATTLQTMGITPGAKVIVYQEPSTDWICSLLAIMRIACVYVPLDITNPSARLAAIVETCQPSAILTDNATRFKVKDLNAGHVLTLNVGNIPKDLTASVPDISRSEDPALMIYTSGSTGTPKGIAVKQLGLRNYIEGSLMEYELQTPQHVLQQSTLSFDISLEQIFTALTTGGSLYVASLRQRGDPTELAKIIRDFNVTYTEATPSEYLLWLQYAMKTLRQCPNWRTALAGGEKCTSTVARQFAILDLPDLRLINGYGPAEASCGSSWYEMPYRQEQEDPIPIGFSYPNYTHYVLDKDLKPVPVGIPGEIVIGGAGVAAGYAKNETLTKSQFVPDPFASEAYIAKGWTTMYRTGDYGNFREDGALIYRNRVSSDLQVKLRGLRIELGDVESNIVRASNGTILEAVVTVRGNNPEFLVAHVVLDTERNVADKDSYLQDLLQNLPIPRYMVPALAIPVDQMPLNNHSKIDRKAVKELPLPQNQSQPAIHDHLTTTEAQLWRLWQDVLSTREANLTITPATTFFQVGGNSLLIVRLQSHIREVLNVVVPVFDLMNSITLGEMARKVEESIAVEMIDWDEETALPAVPTQSTEARSVPGSQPKVVTITGATGFLGRHLLMRLINDSEITEIHCVAVRDNSADSPRQLSVSSPKLNIHYGDLSQPLLGLGEAEFEKLSQVADVIIHLGAVRSFWDNYHVIRPSNVLPVKELVKLAAPRHTPIHFVSSAGVLPSEVTDKASVASSAAAYKPASDGSNGYVASKWAGEQILEKASAQLNIPVSIHRFVPGAEPSPDAVAPVLQWLAQHSETRKLVPNTTGWKGHMDLLKMDEATKAVHTALMQGESGGAQGCASRPRFLHHQSNVRLSQADMEAFIGLRRNRNDLESMDVLDWVGRIKEDGLEYFLTSHVATVQSGDQNANDTLTMRR